MPETANQPTGPDGRLVELQSLSSSLRVMKLNEKLVQEKRIAIEEQIAALIPTGDTGSKTVTLPNGSKVTVKRDLIYKADLVEVARICNESSMVSPIKEKTTRELDKKGYEWYMEKHPNFFLHLAKHVTVTPRKVAVTLKGA